MKINGKNITGVKRTVGIYNDIPTEKRNTVNIWYDNVARDVMCINNAIWEQMNCSSEQYEHTDGRLYLRYTDVTDIIKAEYPNWGYRNISVAQLRFVLETYVV